MFQRLTFKCGPKELGREGKLGPGGLQSGACSPLCLMAHVIEYLLSIKLYLKKQPSGNWGPGSVAEHGLSLSAAQ